METVEIREVLQLCKQFKNTSEVFIQSKPELMERAQAVMAVDAEHLMGIQEKLEEASDDLPLFGFGSDEEELEWIAANPAFQSTSFEFMAALAQSTAKILSPAEIYACLPEGLRGNDKAVELFKQYNAEVLANACVYEPA